MQKSHISPNNCRCGAKACEPVKMAGIDRWQIRCSVLRCQAVNTGYGLEQTIAGWNRLSAHYFR